ncbi:YigZ family protein [Rubeoparvulum massiliense]|uniref:YigZ family protein n=1 Tax=Rubeoparvulum massiliense TaxID=1631346 RepID=UPI000A4459DC|nr:YigZ family protein [Rubeoparvulum massiliense]
MMYQLMKYRTVRPEGEDEIIIQKSRFIGYVAHVETEEDAIQFIEVIKKKHWNATHNCSAYMVGEHDEKQKANDDGEPSGTAGKPILEVIKKMGLKDTAVVVTRYFGGIKLGAGGLIRAYSQATTAGILATGVIERTRHRLVKVTVDYHWQGKLDHQYRQAGTLVQETIFLEKVSYLVAVPSGTEASFHDWMLELTNGEAVIEEMEEVYVDVEVNPHEHDLS